MKNILYILCAVFALASTACQSNDIDADMTKRQQEDIPTETVSVRLSADASQTRVGLLGKSPIWNNEADSITLLPIMNGEYTEDYFVLKIVEGSISPDGKSAEFEGEVTLALGEYEFIAVYGGAVFDFSSSTNFHIEDIYNDIESITAINEYDESPVPYKTLLTTDRFTRNISSSNEIFDLGSIKFKNHSSIISLRVQLDKGMAEKELETITFDPNISCFTFDHNLTLDDSTPYLDTEYDFTANTTGFVNSQEATIINIPIIWAYDSELTSYNKFNFRFDFKDSTFAEFEMNPTQALEPNIVYTKDILLSQFTQKAVGQKEILIEIGNLISPTSYYGPFNWNEETPLSKFAYIDIDELDNVTSISINDASKGEFPSHLIKQLPKLKYLTVYYSRRDAEHKVAGTWDFEEGDLPLLESLHINYSNMTGPLPDLSIFPNLKFENCALIQNNFTGPVPDNHNPIVSIHNNKLSGTLPSSITEHPDWNKIAYNLVKQKDGFGFTNVPDVYFDSHIYGKDDGTTMSTEEYIKGKKLTIISKIGSYNEYSQYQYPWSQSLIRIAEKYPNDVGILTTIWLLGSNESYEKLPGITVLSETEDYGDIPNKVENYPEENNMDISSSYSPAYAIVDSTGKVLFSEFITPVAGFLPIDYYSKNIMETFIDEYMANN